VDTRVLAAIDGARPAHIAAHGLFRADSPLFSSLLLDDGPLTVYDAEGLRHAPYQLVLPACESGVQSPAEADEWQQNCGRGSMPNAWMT
jgi:CHAT domain-containing protein